MSSAQTDLTALRGTVVLLTGASSGLGRATAQRLTTYGATVIAHGRDPVTLEKTPAAHRIVGDLADPREPERLTEAALEAAGRVDILLSNAGVGWAGALADMPGEAVERLIAVNLAGPIALTRLLLPAMIERNSGSLVYVASIAGKLGVAGEAVYAATKAGLDAFAESVRLELHGTGVSVSLLVPGVIDTAFFERRGRPYDRSRPRPLPATLVADALVHGIAARQAEMYVPRWLRLPVAVRGTAPGLYRRLAARLG